MTMITYIHIYMHIYIYIYMHIYMIIYADNNTKLKRYYCAQYKTFSSNINILKVTNIKISEYYWCLLDEQSSMGKLKGKVSEILERKYIVVPFDIYIYIYIYKHEIGKHIARQIDRLIDRYRIYTDIYIQ